MAGRKGGGRCAEPALRCIQPATPYRVLVLVVLMLGLVTTAEHWASMQALAPDPSWQTIRHALKSELPRWGAWLLAVPPARWLIRRTNWTGWRIVPSAIATPASPLSSSWRTRPSCCWLTG